MPRKRRTEPSPESIANSLRTVLGEPQVDRIARRCGWMRRKRDVTPLALVVACLSTLGVASAHWLADILRTFNRLTGKAVRYKPFHNQLAKVSFPEFLRQILEHMLVKLTLPTLNALPNSKLALFEDIMIHDGTSFRLKDSLADEWPGRFKKGSPAAVEIHVTMSALEDNATRIIVAPDKEPERPFSPSVEEVRGCLLLEDRGYEDRRFFQAVHDAGGSFIIRGNKTIKPVVKRAYAENGRRIRRLEGKVLNLKRLPRETVDLDIDWSLTKPAYQGRLVIFCKRGKRNETKRVLLHTNLERKTFRWRDVGQLYRLRWQVELLFKEWKSHANLHRFDTSKSAIAEGLIWASLLVATLKRYICNAAQRSLGVELSTQRVAAAARHFLDDILRGLLSSRRRLKRAVHEALRYMRENTRRAHPKRDREKGRLATGLRPLGVA